MKQLKTDINGGFPFVLDDLRWIDEGNREAFTALAGALLLQDGDLLTAPSHLSISGSTWDIGDFYVYINKEVMYCQGGVFTATAGQSFRLVVEETFDPAGLKNFPNGSPNYQDTYLIRLAEIVISNDASPTPDSYPFNPFNRYLHNRIYDALIADISYFSDYTVNTQTIASPPAWWSYDYSVLGRKGLSKERYLSGQYYCENKNSGDTLFSMPSANLRPTNDVYLKVPALYTTTEEYLWVQITTGGTVKLHSSRANPASPLVLCFDGVSYL